MSNNTGGPAFPAWEQDEYGSKFFNEGITLRDYFAAKALQGLLANQNLNAYCEDAKIAKSAYIIADAMLNEKNHE
jgi:hypothetical protein